MKRSPMALAIGFAALISGGCGQGNGVEEADAMPGDEATPTLAADEWSLAEVIPLSCAQVWATYGSDESLVVEIVKAMAGASIDTRGLAFPETTEAGAALGNGILEGCRTDRDELLYAIVDRNVRMVVTEMGN